MLVVGMLDKNIFCKQQVQRNYNYLWLGSQHIHMFHHIPDPDKLGMDLSYK